MKIIDFGQLARTARDLWVFQDDRIQPVPDFSGMKAAKVSEIF
ncbi:MAG: hypothetical protein AAF557_20640 [Pseudomonadota bacterium]